LNQYIARVPRGRYPTVLGVMGICWSVDDIRLGVGDIRLFTEINDLRVQYICS